MEPTIRPRPGIHLVATINVLVAGGPATQVIAELSPARHYADAIKFIVTGAATCRRTWTTATGAGALVVPDDEAGWSFITAWIAGSELTTLVLPVLRSRAPLGPQCQSRPNAP